MADELIAATDEQVDTDASMVEAVLESIAKESGKGGNTVLLVDDERPIRRRVAREIQKMCGNVVIYEAGNGWEALRKLTEIRQRYQRDPLLMVVDLNMPVMDGWELIESLRQEYQEQGRSQGIPVIVLSSTSGEKGLFFRKSVHGDRSGYVPLVSVAKELCAKSGKYDGSGTDSLLAWVRHFTRQR